MFKKLPKKYPLFTRLTGKIAHSEDHEALDMCKDTKGCIARQKEAHCRSDWHKTKNIQDFMVKVGYLFLNGVLMGN